MNDTSKIIISGLGMFFITIIELYAIYCGINGVALSAVIATLAAIVGGVIGFKIRETQTQGDVEESEIL